MVRSSLLSLLVICAATTSAFTSSSNPWGRRTPRATTSRSMFSTEDDKDAAKPAVVPTPNSIPAAAALATMDEPMSAAVSSDDDGPKSIVRNMNTGELREVKWVDPAMAANTNPLQMSWWAYIAFGFPFVVLADDAFHFLPNDGPLGFLGRL